MAAKTSPTQPAGYSRIAAWMLLGAVLFYHLGTNSAFYLIDQRPANDHELSHVIGAIDYLDRLAEGKNPYTAWRLCSSGYPPVGAIAAAAYTIGGRHHLAARFSQLLFSLVLAGSIFLLGQALFDSWTGVLAAFLMLTSPAACEISRQYLLEWPLTAMTTMAALLLWRGNGFAERRWSLGAGLAVGLAALCKQTFFFFLAGPILYAAVLCLIDRGRAKSAAKTPLRNGLLAGMIAVAVAGIWYFSIGLSNFLGYYRQMSDQAGDAHFSPSAMMYFYQSHLLPYYLTPGLAIIVLAALAPAVFLYRRARKSTTSDETFKPWLFLALWLAIPVFTLQFISIQNEMTLVPALPSLFLAVAALLTAPWRLKSGLVPRAIFALLLIAVVINGHLNAGLFFGPRGYEPLPLGLSKTPLLHLTPHKYAYENYMMPRPEPWHEEEIATAIFKAGRGPKPRLLMMDETPYLNANTFWYLFKLQQREVEVENQWRDDRDWLAPGPDGKPLLYSFDAIFFRQPWRTLYGEVIDNGERPNLWRIFAYLTNPPDDFWQVFRPAGHWLLPDGSLAYLLLQRP